MKMREIFQREMASVESLFQLRDCWQEVHTQAVQMQVKCQTLSHCNKNTCFVSNELFHMTLFDRHLFIYIYLIYSFISSS